MRRKGSAPRAAEYCGVGVDSGRSAFVSVSCPLESGGRGPREREEPVATASRGRPSAADGPLPRRRRWRRPNVGAGVAGSCWFLRAGFAVPWTVGGGVDWGGGGGWVGVDTLRGILKTRTGIADWNPTCWAEW